MVVLNINTAASRLFGDNDHARIRLDGNKILIKPTNSATLALNKTTEDSAPALRKFKSAEGGKRLNGIRLQTDLDLPIGGKFELIPDTYGWFFLSPVNKVYPSMAGASVGTFLDVFSKRPQVEKKTEAFGAKRGRKPKQAA